MPSTLPALKLLLGIGTGIFFSFLLQSIFPSWFLLSPEQQIFVLLGMILCAFAGICAVLLLKKSSPTVQTVVYCGASICAGFAIGIQAQGFTHLSSERTQQRAFQPEMQAVFRGSIEQVLRRDSMPNARIVKVLFEGSLDAEPLPRRTGETVILNVIFPRNDSARTFTLSSPDQLHAGSRIYACVTVHLPNNALLPTDMDEVQYARALGATWLGIAKARDCAVLGESATLRSSIENMQEWLGKRVERLFPPETAPFAFAFLTGSTRYIGMETRQHYARAGTAHVLAVSGLHLAVLAAIVLTPLGFLRSRWGKFWLFAVAVAGFVVGTGLSASAVRSGTMAILAMLVLTVERRAELLNLLAFSVIVLLVAEPNILFSLGFQMSVAAVAGIAVVLPLCLRFFEIVIAGGRDSVRLRGMPQVLWENAVTRYIVQAFALTLSTSFAVAPVVAWHLGSFSLIAPIANLVVVPASSVAMLYTMASVGTSTFWWGGAELFAQTAHECLRFMDAANLLAARPEWSALTGRWAFAAACTASALLLYVVTGTSRRHIVIRLGASIGAVFGVMLWIRLLPNTFETNTQTPLHIYPRKQIAVVALRTPRHLTLLLQDRRLENTAPQADIGLERFVQEYELVGVDSLTLCITGPASMLVASRIATAKLGQAQPNMYIRTLATSLLYKGTRWFQAMDSVQKHSAVFANAAEYFRRDSVVVLAEYQIFAGQDSMRILWDVWQARLLQEGGKIATARRVVVLPLIETEGR